MRTLSKDLITKIVELWKIINKKAVDQEEIEKLSSLLAKLNYQIEPIREKPDRVALDHKNVSELAKFIKDFIVAGVKHPPKVAEYFPCDELSTRILKKFEVKG